MVKKTEISQHVQYTYSFCGKTKMKRWVMGIWHRESCMKTVAGVEWIFNTICAVKSVNGRLKKLKNQ
uniref:Uncharacterized protein n=2 Tax=Sarcophilus harrisii TaxID=9305 RepID=A0A7N4NWT5_SARHA